MVFKEAYKLLGLDERQVAPSLHDLTGRLENGIGYSDGSGYGGGIGN